MKWIPKKFWTSVANFKWIHSSIPNISVFSSIFFEKKCDWETVIVNRALEQSENKFTEKTKIVTSDSLNVIVCFRLEIIAFGS